MLKVIKLKLKELLENNDEFKDRPLREVARLMKIDHVSLWKMVNGKPYNPSLQCLDKICKALHCRPEDILEYKPGKGKTA